MLISELISALGEVSDHYGDLQIDIGYHWQGSRFGASLALLELGKLHDDSSVLVLSQKCITDDPGRSILHFPLVAPPPRTGAVDGAAEMS